MNPKHEASRNEGNVDRISGVRIAYEATPQHGHPIEVAAGIYWIRLPLDSNLDHVNVYALRDHTGWTLVDAGCNSEKCQAALDAVFKVGPLAHLPITRIISTHYHPDHIGLAGKLVKKGAVLYATRVCWLNAKMLQLDDRHLPCHEQIQFVEQAGLKGMELEAYRRRAPSNYSQLVSPLPYSYIRIKQDDVLAIGDRNWTIHVGNGHAAEHATLWSNDGIAITGDQILAGTASNLSVHPSEPSADLVSEWLESCERFMHLSSEETFCLPGHNVPFRGLPTRCEQLLASQKMVLARLFETLDRPKTAVECLDTVYRRTLSTSERGALIAETVGFLNHLRNQGMVERELIGGNAFVWKQACRRARVEQKANIASAHDSHTNERQLRRSYEFE